MTEIFALRLVFYITVLVLGAWGAATITNTYIHKHPLVAAAAGGWWGLVSTLMLGDWLSNG